MKILYLVGFTDWWGNYPPDILDRDDSGTVGGGEAAALYTAFWLGQNGHDVTYCSVATPGTYGGVKFAPLLDHMRTYYAEGPWDAVVAWANMGLLRPIQPGAVRIFAQQLNDLVCATGWEDFCDVIVSPSHTHVKLMQGLTLQPDKVVNEVVYNGVDLRMYPWPPIAPKDRPMQVGWWSSPDRGLQHLLRAWPRIKARVPEAKLKVFYQINKYIAAARGNPGRQGLMSHVLEMLLSQTRHLDVELVDAIPRKRLALEQAKTRVQAYPCDPAGFTEGFACSIVEAMAAGVLPVVRLVDSLPELWGSTAVPLEGVPPSDAFLDEVADKVVWGLTEWAEDPGGAAGGPTMQQLRDHAERFTWDAAGLQMEGVIERAIERTRVSKAA